MCRCAWIVFWYACLHVGPTRARVNFVLQDGGVCAEVHKRSQSHFPKTGLKRGQIMREPSFRV